jgi:hypothetical protein
MRSSEPVQVSEGASHGFEPTGEKGEPDDQRGRLIGRSKGGLNTKLHAVTDAKSRPLKVFMTAGPPLAIFLQPAAGQRTGAMTLTGSEML